MVEALALHGSRDLCRGATIANGKVEQRGSVAHNRAENAGAHHASNP